MKKNSLNVYPMAKIGEMLTTEEINEMSKNYEFNEDDEFFHFDKEVGMLESLNATDIAFYNSGMAEENKLRLAV